MRLRCMGYVFRVLLILNHSILIGGTLTEMPITNHNYALQPQLSHQYGVFLLYLVLEEKNQIFGLCTDYGVND